jgi:Tfp pilus assembly protein PilV
MFRTGRDLPAVGHGRARERGSSMSEALLAMVIVSIALAGVAGVLGSNLKVNAHSQDLTSGARSLREVLASVDAQTYDALLAMNGNTFYDTRAAGNARFRVELTTAVAAVDMISIAAVLKDQRTGRELSRVASFRSRR